MSLEHLKQSLYEAPIVKKGEYDYVIHPITDGVPFITPGLLKEVSDEMKKHIKKYGKFDRIVTMEVPGEVSVEQVTGYSKSKLYINGLKKGDTIVIVDDVLSTGGTLRAVLSVFKKMNVNVKGVFIAINKGSHIQEISKEFNVPITSIIDIDVVNGEVVIES